MSSTIYVSAWLPVNGPVVLPVASVPPSRQRTGFVMSGFGGTVLGAPHATDIPAEKPPYVSAPERCP